mmetsp:Transcript_12972/g.34606  ORF Transcript_12972/g.34606 Transcript_12972/m.34606 type:complete len:983 (-) Transcript_12972:390-3338(-)|eukprot:CAMPEP_0185210858 /NCGR_PEP_ID=MMETSP1140-20130426/66408_1 /TAXON_ID=298111 /ORGANISM="Pavlova sp., Strain CCMP459" /LENGTH=982 /DNA_ID=CAMNT_0027778687 /DNA_START=151 /DNA_END=3099 /DNA_ORIENTATION=-
MGEVCRTCKVDLQNLLEKVETLTRSENNLMQEREKLMQERAELKQVLADLCIAEKRLQAEVDTLRAQGSLAQAGVGTRDGTRLASMPKATPVSNTGVGSLWQHAGSSTMPAQSRALTATTSDNVERTAHGRAGAAVVARIARAGSDAGVNGLELTMASESEHRGSPPVEAREQEYPAGVLGRRYLFDDALPGALRGALRGAGREAAGATSAAAGGPSGKRARSPGTLAAVRSEGLTAAVGSASGGGAHIQANLQRPRKHSRPGDEEGAHAQPEQGLPPGASSGLSPARTFPVHAAWQELASGACSGEVAKPSPSSRQLAQTARAALPEATHHPPRAGIHGGGGTSSALAKSTAAACGAGKQDHGSAAAQPPPAYGRGGGGGGSGVCANAARGAQVGRLSFAPPVQYVTAPDCMQSPEHHQDEDRASPVPVGEERAAEEGVLASLDDRDSPTVSTPRPSGPPAEEATGHVMRTQQCSEEIENAAHAMPAAARVTITQALSQLASSTADGARAHLVAARVRAASQSQGHLASDVEEGMVASLVPSFIDEVEADEAAEKAAAGAQPAAAASELAAAASHAEAQEKRRATLVLAPALVLCRALGEATLLQVASHARARLLAAATRARETPDCEEEEGGCGNGSAHQDGDEGADGQVRAQAARAARCLIVAWACCHLADMGRARVILYDAIRWSPLVGAREVAAFAEGWPALLSPSQAHDLACAVEAVICGDCALAKPAAADRGPARRLMDRCLWAGAGKDETWMAALREALAPGGVRGGTQGETGASGEGEGPAAALASNVRTRAVQRIVADLRSAAQDEIRPPAPLLTPRVFSQVRALQLIGARAGRKWAYMHIYKGQLLNLRHPGPPPAAGLEPAPAITYNTAEAVSAVFCTLFAPPIALSEKPQNYITRRMVRYLVPWDTVDQAHRADERVQHAAAHTVLRLGLVTEVRRWFASLPLDASQRLPPFLVQDPEWQHKVLANTAP